MRVYSLVCIYLPDLCNSNGASLKPSRSSFHNWSFVVLNNLKT